MEKKTITIEVEELEERTMFMSVHFGDGTLGETKFDASFALPTYSPVITVDGKRYRVSTQEVIRAVIEMHEGGQKSACSTCDGSGYAENPKDPTLDRVPCPECNYPSPDVNSEGVKD